MERKEINEEGATVPFYEYSTDEGRVIEFDSSQCGPPEPMINAMTALKYIDKDTKVIMINHKTPGGLIKKIEENYDIEQEKIAGGLVKLTFSYRAGESEKANLDDSACSGH